MLEVIAERKCEPEKTDILTKVTQFRIDNKPISDEEILGIAFILFLGGLDTVLSSLSFQIRYLAENPVDQEKLRADTTLIPKAIEELFRAFAIVTSARTATQDLELAGVNVKEGELVTVPSILANRDPAEFPNPNTVDLTRTPNRHNTFSFGAHHCLGTHLARLEITIALEELLNRLPPFSLAPDAEIRILGGGVLGVEELQLIW